MCFIQNILICGIGWIEIAVQGKQVCQVHTWQLLISNMEMVHLSPKKTTPPLPLPPSPSPYLFPPGNTWPPNQAPLPQQTHPLLQWMT